MLKKVLQSEMLQFCSILLAVGLGIVFADLWLEKIPDAQRLAWLGARWWQIGLVVAAFWLIGKREANRYLSGYRRGLSVARTRVRKAENRSRILQVPPPC